MTRQQHRYDDAFDDDGILKDGRSVHVSMRMRDASMARGKSAGTPEGTGSHGPRGEVEGDVCTRNGWPGVLKRGSDGELFCDIGRKDAQPAFTDGRTTDPTALNRPGFRVPTIQDRRAVHDVYDRYNTGLVNAYKLHDGEMQCSTCFGSGQGPDGDDCPRCGGSGVMEDTREGKSRFGSTNEGSDDDPDPASDSITFDQHRKNLDRLYAERDAELSNAWRKG